MVMRYHWGHGVGHTYAHHFRKTREASSHDSQRDVEMGAVQENVPQATRSIRSNLGSNVTNHTNDKTDGEDNGTASGDDDDYLDDENYNKYDEDDDDYNY